MGHGQGRVEELGPERVDFDQVEKIAKKAGSPCWQHSKEK